MKAFRISLMMVFFPTVAGLTGCGGGAELESKTTTTIVGTGTYES